nr:reverse transcriptase domain-containing protein [Tanacetum cinerariifolium]
MPVKIGDAKHFTSTWMNFVVVKSPSPYNGIIGRPRVRKIQAVPSTAHRMLKFSVPGGILTLCSIRIIPLKCTMVSGPKTQPFDIIQAAEERIKMAIHPEYPEQKIAIGFTLTKKGRKALCDLLRRNLDIFHWKPVDMTGVPRHIAEHRLNVRDGCSPVRQRKRSQALERNKTIEDEVEKLVDIGIIKEVHYHSWLSDSVMVKKHDDSWKIRMDFKDLNKACLKDEECMFLGYKVNTKGIKVCPNKVEAVLSMSSSKCLKDVQKLNGLPTLTGPMEKEKLIVYLAATREAEGSTWMTPIYEYFTEETLFAEKEKARPLQANYVLREIHEGIVQYTCWNEIRGSKIPTDRINEEALEINLDLLEKEGSKRKSVKQEARQRWKNITTPNPKWEGPYEVTKALGSGAYKLRDHNGKLLSLN